jgi:hypothetical protein
MSVRRLVLLAAAAWLGGCAAPPSAPVTPAASPLPAPKPVAATGATPAVLQRAGVANAGFEATAQGPRGDPQGWFSFQHAGPLSYKFTVDAAERKSGERSLRIDNTGPEIYGAIAQGVDARPWRGKVARLSAWVKTRDADDGGAVLTLLALQSGATLAQNFMPDAPIKGTTGWNRYTITLALPQNADKVEVGMMLQGRGAAWLDDVELEIVEP